MSEVAEKSSLRIGPERSVLGSLEAVSLTERELARSYEGEGYLRGCRRSTAEFV